MRSRFEVDVSEDGLCDPTHDDGTVMDGAPGQSGSQSKPHSRGRTMRLVSRVVRSVSQRSIQLA